MNFREKRTEVQKLICSVEIAKKLVTAGIQPISAFHYADVTDYFTDGDEASPKYTLDMIDEPDEASVPAWTMEELRIMVGNKFLGGNLPEPRPKPMKGEETTFYVYYLETCKHYESGAEANADLLLYLLEKKLVTAEEVNKRYMTKFITE